MRRGCTPWGRAGEMKESSVRLGKKSPTRGVILIATGGAGMCEVAVLERGLNSKSYLGPLVPLLTLSHFLI